MTRNASAPLWVRVLLVAVLVVGAVPGWLFAAGYAFNALLYRDQPTSPPVTLMTWPSYFKHHRHLEKVQGPLKLSGLGASVPFVVFFVLLMMKPKRSLHGDAKWGKKRDAVKAGLLDGKDDGIIVGKWGNEYLTASLDRYPHVMLAAPTGSGKGVGTVIPNLLNWNHSVIVLDIKHENWTLTAGFRHANGHQVFMFDPLNPERRTHRWNPLSYLDPNPDLRVSDVQAIAQILFPDIDGSDPIWSASCRQLFTGVVLYLVETPEKPATLGQVYREMTLGDDKRWKKIIEKRQADGNPLTIACQAALEDYVNVHENTRTSVRKTFTSRLELFSNPIIDAATSASDFDLTALRKRRISIYLGITPNTLDRLAPLLNLFFQQVVNLNTRQLPEHNPELKYQVLLLPDEFRSLGKMQVLVTAIAFLRGYGLRLLPIFQAPAQVREVYGDDAAKTFFKNHHVRLAYTPADIDDATEISRELGNFTFKAKSKSAPEAFSKGNRSHSESDQARALLLPQEVKDIGDDEVIIFAKGALPLRATKIRWYEDKTFKDRIMPPPALRPAPVAAVGAVEDPGDWRPVDEGDMDKLYERPASDFSLSFSETEIPKGDLSEEDAVALADRLYEQMTR